VQNFSALSPDPWRKSLLREIRISPTGLWLGSPGPNFLGWSWDRDKRCKIKYTLRIGRNPQFVTSWWCRGPHLLLLLHFQTCHQLRVSNSLQSHSWRRPRRMLVPCQLKSGTVWDTNHMRRRIKTVVPKYHETLQQCHIRGGRVLRQIPTSLRPAKSEWILPLLTA
jgi:hypothetical protein